MGLNQQYLFLTLWSSSAMAFLPSGGEGRRYFCPVKTRADPTQPGQSIPSRRLKNPDEIRGGQRYGSENNSTILSPEEVAEAVGVLPTSAKASKKTWQRAWKLHKRALPLLHVFDRNKPPDSSLSLAVLWWKALSGNDESSPASDGGLSYDLLPRGTRKIVSKTMRRLYPRLHHANVELRTAFIDRAIANVVETIRQSDASNGAQTRIRLVIFGGGYDIRSIKMTERNIVDEAIELDLPKVIEAKRRLLKNRLLRRRRNMTQADLPDMMCIDLNKVNDVRHNLDRIVSRGDKSKSWHNIILFEGVMIYLDEGVPSDLLNTCSDVLNSNNVSGSLVFADRLENIPEGDLAAANVELSTNGWELVEWLPKPGLARHMGSARLL